MNVILVIFDSLREDCIGCLGSPYWGKVHTPNLDKFAEESLVLKKCYPESLPTLPARRAIYTGKRVFPFKGEEKRLKGDWYGAPGWGPIPEDMSTISEILEVNGYSTALISDVFPQFKPSKNFHRGFHVYICVRGFADDEYRSGPIPRKDEINFWLPKEIRSEINIEFMKNLLINLKGMESEEDYTVAKVMRESVKWLEQNIDRENKFLLIESFSPHEPWITPRYYRDIYCDSKLRQQVLSTYEDVSEWPEDLIKITQASYSAHVTMCDWWFGYLYNSISRLGMLDNTLIIVTTDHGHSIGDNNYLGKSGYPSTPEVYDIPILLRHPSNEFERGKISNMLVQHTDILATILDILGINVDKEIDYYRWEHVVANSAYAEAQRRKLKDFTMHGKSFFNKLINGDEKFREHVTVAWGPNITVITDKWWLNCRVNGKGAFLFDLNSEDCFTKNVAGTNPDIVRELFNISVEDAGGSIPQYLITLADNEKDVPGCSALALK